MGVSFETQQLDGKALIVVSANLDSEEAGKALSDAFERLYEAENQKTIVLDLSKVKFINSYGIGRILRCYKRMKSEGGVLMVRPLTGFVKETFELLMLDNLFPVDEATGLESVQ
ncbi:MAG: STAS domain-containing protein [Bdellovibrionales bacterium]|nr:STAS domain-containing protein [Bdellovibrionales bacterium]